MLFKKNGATVFSLTGTGDITFSAFYEESNLSTPVAAGSLQMRASGAGEVALATRDVALATRTITDVQLRGRFSTRAVFPGPGADPAKRPLHVKASSGQVVAALTAIGDLLVKSDDLTTLPDPGFNGDYTYTSAVYAGLNLHYPAGLPEYKIFETPTAQYVTRTIDVSDLTPSVSKPRQANPNFAWPFAITGVPINGIARIPDGAGPFPLVLFAHGNHDPVQNSTRGYIYLCETLASWGIIAATIDVNFLNGWIQGEIGARAVIHLEHVKQFELWNAEPGHPLQNRVDLQRVMIAGHSRGGEAVAHASMFNRMNALVPHVPPHDIPIPLDGSGLRPLGPYQFGIRGVIAIAPTDDYYRPVEPILPYKQFSTIVENTNYLLIHGTMDADLTSFPGYRCYDRALPYDTGDMTAPATGTKALLWLYTANHNYFNSVWGLDDPTQDATRLMSPAVQANTARVFFGGWAQMFLLNRSSYRPLFHRPGLAFDRDWLRSYTLVSQYHDAERLWLQTFDNTGPVQLTPPVTGNVVLTNAKVLGAYLDRGDKSFLYQQTGGLRVEWGTAGENYQIQNIDFHADTSRFQVLAFRVGQSPEPKNASQIDQDFTISVSDGTHVYSARASTFGRLPYPGALSDPPTNLKIEYARKVVMQTLRIPLSALAAAGLDVAAITSVHFTFNANSQGTLYFDDVQLSL